MSFSSQKPEYNEESVSSPKRATGIKQASKHHTEAAADASANPTSEVSPENITVEVDLNLQPKKEPSLFRNRNFMLLWIAQALTQTAQNTLNLALVDYVSRLTNGSPTATAIATVAFVLPGVFFSALAGVFVDRFNKRYILIATNGLR